MWMALLGSDGRGIGTRIYKCDSQSAWHLHERERELRKEGREVPSRVRLREGPIGVRITLGQPTIG